MDVVIIEEFTNEKKFANRVKEYFKKNGTSVRVKFSTTLTPKGVLYSAMMIKY